MKQVFVSSTFRDMHIERDLIQTKLIPDLNEKAYQNRIEGIKFQDLRWGIDTDTEDEEDKDKKILEVCLDEIENKRPYFCVLLGDRYGWIPDNDLVKETGIRYGIYDENELIEKSITNLEVDYAFLRNPQYAKNSYAYIRNISGDVKGTIYESDENEKARIEKLKAEIKEILPAENIHEYDVVYKDGNLIGTEKFIEFAKNDMTRVLLEDDLIKEDLTENQKEILYHKTQAREKSVISNARRSIEEKIMQDIKRQNIITIKGESGNGKSTLMSKISSNLSKYTHSLIFFSSLTPKTTSSIGLMRIITKYINEIIQKEDQTFETLPINEIIGEFENDIEQSNKNPVNKSKEEKLYELAIREYSNKGKKDIIILIDAIDQLDNPSSISNLIKPLSLTDDSKVKFIISYLDDKRNADDFIFLNNYTNYTLGELSKDDRLAVINSSLADNNKQLPYEIKEEIINKEASKSPLYISLLVQRLLMMNELDYLNIIRSGDGYEKITSYQKELIQKMPNDLKKLILELITQASKNLDTNTDEVENTISYLAVSRRGLRESDLKKIYELKGESYNSLDFATLKRYLRAFFLEDKYLRIDFTHKIIRQAVLEVLNTEIKSALHNDIANAFMCLPVEDPIKLQEQYYSAYKSSNKKSALELLEGIAKNISKLSPEEIESSIESITKLHNISINYEDDAWIKDLFEDFIKFDLNIQKILLAYFAYRSYEEKTSESLKAAKHNGIKLLEYLEKLLEIYPNDKEIIRFYADQLRFIGMKYNLGSKKDLRRSEEYLLKSIKLNEYLFDVDKSLYNKESLANSYSNIARFYLDLGPRSKEKARYYYKKSVNMFEEIVSLDNTMINNENLAIAYNNIANLYASGYGKNAMNKAKDYYKKTIAIIQRLLNKYEDIGLKKTLAMGYINIASLYFSQGDYNRSETWYYRAIDIISQIENIEPSFENKETLAKSYNNIGDLFSSELIDDKIKAEDFYLKAKIIFESILKSKEIVSAKKNLSITYDNLASLYADWKLEESYNYYEKAIELKEDLLNISKSNEEVIDLATSYNNLGFLYVDNKRNYEHAKSCYNKAIDLLYTVNDSTSDKKYGENLAVSYTNLGSVYFMINDNKKSETYYRKAIKIHKDLIRKYEDDDNIEKLLIIYNNLACHMLDIGYSLEDIENVYIQAIELIKMLKDPYKKRKKTAITYNNLANLYLIKSGDYKICEDCYKKSIDLTKWVINYHWSVENVERLMVNYNNLAKLYNVWSKEDLKEKYLNLSIEIADQIDYKNNKENINKFIYKHTTI